MSDSEGNLHLEIGHVLFIDIVGYSKLLNEEQKERLNQLTEIVLGTAQVRESSDEQLVRLPTGDGFWSASAISSAHRAGSSALWRKTSAIPARLQGRPALHRLRAKDRRDAESRCQSVIAMG